MAFSRPCGWPEPLRLHFEHAEDRPQLSDLPKLATGLHQDVADTRAGIESDLGWIAHFGAELTAEHVTRLEAVRLAAIALQDAASQLRECVTY
jgi:hypothetical protein